MSISITLPTNLNNKLSCNYFVHVAAAPKKFIPEREMNGAVITIYTEDNSHPPVQVKLVDTIRTTLNDLGSICTYPSHGQHSFEFANAWLQQHPGTPLNQPMCVYFYQKIQL